MKTWTSTSSTPCCPEFIPVFDIQNLSLAYGNKVIFQNLTMPIAKGCVTALVGPSGSGKSSFISCLNRLTDFIPEARVSGSITYSNSDIFEKSFDVTNYRREVGMIFQKPNPFPLSIKANLQLPLYEIGIKSKTELKDTIEATLKSVGLWAEVSDRLDSPATKLSGGQQQRLCIARALVLKPKVLLMDEPCSSLDPISTSKIETLISDLRCQMTILIVTHNLAQAKRISDYTGLFWTEGSKSRMEEFGTTKNIFDNPVSEVTNHYVSGLRG